MKSNVLVSFITIVASFFPLTVFAAASEGRASAVISAPLKISNEKGLRFGKIVPGVLSGGAIELGADGDTNCGSSLICFSTFSAGAAVFTITGFNDVFYEITVPKIVTLSGIGEAAGETMTALLDGSKAFGTLKFGVDRFTVGGSLEVGAGQKTGVYIGIFAVTVEYH